MLWVALIQRQRRLVQPIDGLVSLLGCRGARCGPSALCLLLQYIRLETGFFLFSVLVQLQRLVSACSADCALIQRRCDCLVQAVLAFPSACSADASY